MKYRLFGDGSRELGFFAAQTSFDDERAERNDCGDEDFGGPTEGAFQRHGGADERDDIEDEKEAVDHADDAHCLGHVGSVFQRHGHEEQQQGRGSFDQPDVA